MSISDFVGLAVTTVITAAFIRGLRPGMSALIVLRPACDRIFEAGRFHVASHDFSFGAVLNAIVIGTLILNLPRVRERVPPKLAVMWPPFLLMTLLATVYSPVPGDAFRKFLTYVTCGSIFLLAFVLIRTRADLRHYLKMILLSSLIPVLYGAYELVSRTDIYPGGRIQSTFSHPNIFAFYLLLNIGIVLFLHASRTIRARRSYLAIAAVYLVPLFLMLVMTKTRSAWVACLLLLLSYGIVYDRRVLVFALGLPPILALAIPEIRSRIMDLETGNNYVGWVQQVNAYAWRNLLWHDAFPWILKKPLQGWGLYSFPYYSPQFFPLERAHGVDAHNVFVQLAFETGFVGLLCYLWIYVRGLSWIALYSRYDRQAVAMVVAIVVGYLVVCWSDNLLEYISFNWAFWFSVGLMFAYMSAYRSHLRMLQQTRGQRSYLALDVEAVMGVRQTRPSVAE
ncbi:MAG: O-antigen ligase family protein [Alphaproteobacteria bacterium]|nr:O-antigen ligase family protein [Alphaproteobacteria bacterium]